MNDQGTPFLAGLGIGLLVAFMVWSNMSDAENESFGEREAVESELSRSKECIESQRSEINDLRSTITSTREALSAATEPGFGYNPPYEDLVESLVSANAAISGGYTSGMIHVECDL